MADKTYVVTLKSKDDLDGFYADMASDGIHCVMKRPISRNTHYKMNDTQVAAVRADSRVLAVAIPLEDRPDVRNEELAYTQTRTRQMAGNFGKMGTYGSTGNGNYLDWGKLHCAGNDTQRRKVVPVENLNGADQWPLSLNNVQNRSYVDDTVQIYGDGKDVDIIICDSEVPHDHPDWNSPTTGNNRFVQYDWHGQLNSYVSSIDDDGGSLKYSNYPAYPTCASAGSSNDHGTHVMGTAGGKYYGWAPDANLYNFYYNHAYTGTLFDYFRAFHSFKPLNSTTCKRNPTIMNHSWAPIHYGWGGSISISEVNKVVWRGVTYNSSNPNPSGWNMTGLKADFGIHSSWYRVSLFDAAFSADVEDAIADGVVVIAAAANSDRYMVPYIDPTTGTTHQDWNNYMDVQGSQEGDIYLCRAGSMQAAKGTISVGALGSNSDFRKADFSNYGPDVDVFAPGDDILSNTATGEADARLGSGYYYGTYGGTSMASPQVCGVAACIASGKDRFTNDDLLGYIQQHSKYDDMTKGIEPYSIDYSQEIDGATDASSWIISGYDSSGTNHSQAANPALQNYEGGSFTFSPPYFGSVNGALEAVSGSNVSLQYTDRGYQQTPVTADNPTITLERGDMIQFYHQSYAGGSITWYLKDTISAGTANQVSSTHVTGQGMINVADNLVFDTTSVPIGAYYFINSADTNMRVTIVVQGKATTWDHPFWITTTPLLAGDLNKRYNITFTAGGGAYTVNNVDAEHRGGAIAAGTANPNLDIRVGDIIRFKNDVAAAHPLWINTTNSTGTSSGVSADDHHIDGNGTSTDGDEVFFCPRKAGTYYYNCELHSSMNGTITVTDIPNLVAEQTVANGNIGVSNNGAFMRTAYGGNNVGFKTDRDTAGLSSGTYHYCHGLTLSKQGVITVTNYTGNIGLAGGFDDDTSLRNTINRYLQNKNPRESGYLAGWYHELHGSRQVLPGESTKDKAVLFPRQNTLHRKSDWTANA